MVERSQGDEEAQTEEHVAFMREVGFSEKEIAEDVERMKTEPPKDYPPCRSCGKTVYFYCGENICIDCQDTQVMPGGGLRVFDEMAEIMAGIEKGDE